MPINASIPLGVQPFKLEQPEESPLNMMAKVLQMRSSQTEQAVNGLKLQELQRGVTENNGLNQAYKGALGSDGSVDRTKLFQLLAGQGLGSKIPTVQKTFTEADKAKSDLDKSNMETAAKRLDTWGQGFGYLKQNPTPENAHSVIQYMVNAGAMTPEHAAPIIAQIQQNPTPQNIGQLAEIGFRSALAAKDQLPKYETRNTGGSTDTIAIDPVTGQVRVANTVTNTQSPDNAASVGATMRGQNMTDSRARDTLAQTERHFQAGQSAPQYMETDSGLVALPKKLAPGQAPTGTPVMGPDGQPLSKPLKQIPVAANTAIITNTQNLNKAQQALALLEGQQVGAMQGDKSATGFKGMLPGMILNRVDPKGVDTRAAIADLGSMVLHDRSGAAVTASEYPRLQPFIPAATDDDLTAAKKLRRFIQVFDQENQALQQTYSKDQGYKPSAVKPAAPAVTPPAASQAPQGLVRINSDAEYGALPSGALFVGPDGKQRRKP